MLDHKIDEAALRLMCRRAGTTPEEVKKRMVGNCPRRGRGERGRSRDKALRQVRQVYCTTTKQDKSLVPSPNLVKDMKIDRPDQALCSDITYIYTEEGFLFLSLTMDMYVREGLEAPGTYQPTGEK